MDQILTIATAFGLALFHSLWIGAVLYAAVRALYPLLKTPAARHHLAYGALLALVSAFGLTAYFLYDPNPVCENLVATALPGFIVPPSASGMAMSCPAIRPPVGSGVF